jgi:hypothetical protein
MKPSLTGELLEILLMGKVHHGHQKKRLVRKDGISKAIEDILQRISKEASHLIRQAEASQRLE